MNEDDTDLFMDWLVRDDVEIAVHYRADEFWARMTSPIDSRRAVSTWNPDFDVALNDLSEVALLLIAETQGE